MRRQGCFYLITLLMAVIMIFSVWNPSIFAVEGDGLGLEEDVEATEILDKPDSEGKLEGQDDMLDQQEDAKDEDNLPIDEDVKLKDEERGSKEDDPYRSIEDKAPKLETYLPSSPSIRVGPIMTWLNTPIAKPRVRGLNGGSGEAMEGLELSKTASIVEASEDDYGRQTFRLDLTASTESEIVEVVSPSDIVLVLDRSGSMGEYLGSPISSQPDTDKTYYVRVDGEFKKVKYSSKNVLLGPSKGWYYGSWPVYRYVEWDPNGDEDGSGGGKNNPRGKPFYTLDKTRMEALKSSAKNFVTSIGEKSADSRIALVSFSGDARTDIGLSELGSNSLAIKNAIDGLKASGATYSSKGLEEARGILQDESSDRNRVVIMFTDGEPGYSGFDNSEAAKTINQAAVIKGQRGNSVSSNVKFMNSTPGKVTGEGIGATLYTIGIFSSEIDKDNINSYMTWVSSHKPYGTDYETAPGEIEPNREKGYYFTADSADSLERIFQGISQETGTTIEGVTIRDYIDPRFDVVNDQGQVLNTGDEINIDGSEVGTLESDENGLYVKWTKAKIEPGEIGEGKGFKGSLYLRPKDDFIGGNNIPTNLANISAIYQGDNSIGSFPEPMVNVPLKLTMNSIGDSIFLGENIPRSMAEAQKDMLEEKYEYPSGMLNYEWDSSYEDNFKPEDNTTYKLTLNVTPGIANSEAIGNHATEGDITGSYTIGVQKGKLIIQKRIENGSVDHDPNQSFVFQIKQYDGPDGGNPIRTFYETIRASDASHSRIIINLAKGYYQVVEKSDWSWQYDPVGDQAINCPLGMDEAGVRDINKVEGVAKFVNTAKKTNYLTSIDWVINRFTGGE